MSRRELTRHDTDIVSLVAGLVLLAIAVGFLVEDLTDVSVNGGVLAPVALLVVGVAGLVVLARGRRADAPLEDGATEDERTEDP